MRKILGIASLIMSTGVVHAEQVNEQEQISPYSANVTFASQYISRGFQQTWGQACFTNWTRLCKSEWIICGNLGIECKL